MTAHLWSRLVKQGEQQCGWTWAALPHGLLYRHLHPYHQLKMQCMRRSGAPRAIRPAPAPSPPLSLGSASSAPGFRCPEPFWCQQRSQRLSWEASLQTLSDGHSPGTDPQPAGGGGRAGAGCGFLGSRWGAMEVRGAAHPQRGPEIRRGRPALSGRGHKRPWWPWAEGLC